MRNAPFRVRLLLVPLLLATAFPAFAQSIRTLASGQAPPAAAVQDMAWLAGEWVSEDGRNIEAYSPPHGGVITGHFIQADAKEPRFYELIEISPAGNSIHLRIKHFSPGLKSWEAQDKATEFPFVGREGDSWFFEGLTYRRVNPDRMTVIVNIRGKDGSYKERSFPYRRR